MGLKKLKSSEHDEQVQVIEFCNLHIKQYPCLEFLYAVPNGARTSISVAKRLKAEGMKAGVPDLFLPFPMIVPRWNMVWYGLYIEMKVKGGTVSKDQKKWIAYLKEQGYKVEVCWNAEEAIKAIMDYLIQ